jgi:hypothetical protein
MIHKYDEFPTSQEKLFDNQPSDSAQSELHTVWTSQLVRIKEIVDSKYNRNHPLEITFGQNFSRTH